MEKHVAIFSSSGSGLKFFSYFFAAVLLFQFLFEYSVDYEGGEACRKVGGNPVSPGKIHRSCINKQTTTIQAQIEGLNQAKTMCERMLESGNISFDDLQVEKYVKLFMFYCSVSRGVFYNVCIWIDKKCSCCITCRYGCTYWDFDCRNH